MRFDCGKTRWEKYNDKIARLTNWHKKFAWLPVRVAPHDCRWLEFYERKGTIDYWSDGEDWTWEKRGLEPFIG